MIELSKDGPVWRLRINRPDKANSLTEAMLDHLISAVKSAQDGPNVLVLSAHGKVFSAGADLDEVKNGLATSSLWEELSGAIATLPCLTIAALNGTLAGGAFGMVLACDLRISVDTAEFFYPVIKHGVLPQPSDPARLTALVGPSRAKMILLAGQRLSAAEALDWGLVDRITSLGDLDAGAMALCREVINADIEHIENIKRMIDPVKPK